MKWTDFEKKLLENNTFKAEYNKVDYAFEMSRRVIDARIACNMTQAELAAILETKQPSIARLEAGNTLPSLQLLKRVADALETELLLPSFGILKSTYNQTKSVEWAVLTVPEARPVRREMKRGSSFAPVRKDEDYVYNA